MADAMLTCRGVGIPTMATRIEALAKATLDFQRVCQGHEVLKAGEHTGITAAGFNAESAKAKPTTSVPARAASSQSHMSELETPEFDSQDSHVPVTIAIQLRRKLHSARGEIRAIKDEQRQLHDQQSAVAAGQAREIFEASRQRQSTTLTVRVGEGGQIGVTEVQAAQKRRQERVHQAVAQAAKTAKLQQLKEALQQQGIDPGQSELHCAANPTSRRSSAKAVTSREPRRTHGAPPATSFPAI